MLQLRSEMTVLAISTKYSILIFYNYNLIKYRYLYFHNAKAEGEITA